jgi:hypothetical protein
MSLNSPGPLTLDSSGMLLYPNPGGWSEVRLEDVVRWRPGTQVAVIRHPVAGFPETGPMKVMRDHPGCIWLGAEGGNSYDCGEGPRDPLFKGARPRSNLHEGCPYRMYHCGTPAHRISTLLRIPPESM